MIRVAHVAAVDLVFRDPVMSQLRLLRDEGYDVTAISAPGPFVSELEEEGIRHRSWQHAPTVREPQAIVRGFAELVTILRSERSDIVHTYTPEPGPLGRLAARVAGVPVIVNTVDGYGTASRHPSKRQLSVMPLERVASTFSDLELFRREEDLHRARRSYIVPPSRRRYLGNGIDLARSYEEIMLRRGLAQRRLDQEGLRSVTLRRARPADVPAIARMHIEVLSTGSLQLLGERFLRELFVAQVRDPDAVVVVAVRDHEIVGYSSGVLSTSVFRRRFLVRHGARAAIAAAPRLAEPGVGRKVLETARYPDSTRGLPEAEHLFLGVKRGLAPGLGAQLTREVIDALAWRGAVEVKGFVAADNRPMLSMLRRVGFEVRGEMSLHDGRPSYVVVIRCPLPSRSLSAAS